VALQYCTGDWAKPALGPKKQGQQKAAAANAALLKLMISSLQS
jgi:hypothetical protein